MYIRGGNKWNLNSVFFAHRTVDNSRSALLLLHAVPALMMLHPASASYMRYACVYVCEL